MVHTLLENVPSDDKEIKRIFSLEQRVAELENQLLRASASALEKRVKELEFSLKESNEECIKLRQTINNIKISSNNNNNNNNKIGKNNDDDNNDNNCSNYVNSDNDSKEDYNSIGGGEEVIDKESDIIYERILKLVETMKLDCTRSINFKIPVHSGLPKFPTRQNSRSNLSKASTANIARPRTPSLAGASRPSTPSGIQRPSTPSPTSLTSSPSCIQRPSTPSGIQSPSSIQRPSAPSGIQIPSNTNNYIAPIYTNINNNNNSGSITTSPTKMPTPATKRPTLARASTVPYNNNNSSSSSSNNKLPSRPSTPTGMYQNRAPNVTSIPSRPSTPGTISPPLTTTVFTSPIKTAIPAHIPIMRNCRQSTV